MKRLIKRYVLKAQVDRENDEVNEGKWNFITDTPNEHVLLLLMWPVGGMSSVKILCRESLPVLTLRWAVLTLSHPCALEIPGPYFSLAEHTSHRIFTQP